MGDEFRRGGGEQPASDSKAGCSRLHIDLAWAQTQAKNDMEAILHLHAAERVAPESIRYHTIARELVRELLRRSRKLSPSLTAFATRAGALA